MVRTKDLSNAKNRVHSIVFSEKSELIFREITKANHNDKSWIHKYISDKLIEEFEKKITEKYLVYVMNEHTKQRNYHEDKIIEVKNKINQLKGA